MNCSYHNGFFMFYCANKIYKRHFCFATNPHLIPGMSVCVCACVRTVTFSLLEFHNLLSSLWFQSKYRKIWGSSRTHMMVCLFLVLLSRREKTELTRGARGHTRYCRKISKRVSSSVPSAPDGHLGFDLPPFLDSLVPRLRGAIKALRDRNIAFSPVTFIRVSTIH